MCGGKEKEDEKSAGQAKRGYSRATGGGGEMERIEEGGEEVCWMWQWRGGGCEALSHESKAWNRQREALMEKMRKLVAGFKEESKGPPDM